MTDVLAVVGGLLALSAVVVFVVVAMMAFSACLVARTALRHARRSRWLREVKHPRALTTAVTAATMARAHGKDIAMSFVALRSLALRAGSRAGSRAGDTRGDVVRLRVRLYTSVRHAERVLDGPALSLARPAEFSDMLRSLKATATHLDRHLALIEREPDERLRAIHLQNARPPAEQVIADATALRGAAYRLADDLRGLVQP